MATNLMFASTLFFILSCSNKNNKENVEQPTKDSAAKYAEKIIDSLNMRLQYDSAKWFVYEKQSRDTLEWSINAKDTERLTLGELSLELAEIKIKNDTLDINFCYSKQPKYTSKDVFVGNECIIITVGVNYNTKQFLYYKTACNFDVFFDKLLEKKLKESRTLFVDYVKNNFAKLDTWFKTEVLKRKIISL